jgi:peroxiredoxin
MNVQVLGISVDHVPCLKAWAESLEEISYPLLSDFWPHGEVAEIFGVLRSDGKSERAIFIIDKEGVIQYIDIHDIDDQPSNEVLFEELARIDPEAARKAEARKPVFEDLPQGGVVMYCNKWCPACRKARIWFSDNDIEFQEVDVVLNKQAAYQVRKWADGNLTTPTFDIDGTVVVDWKPEQLEQLLLK